ncbi:MAG: NAD-binding protein, partial [Roseovarius sp.]|nr:NAD-binding protein [Roseovarius sp.]
KLPLKERLLVAFTGPRGVVLVAVAGLFGERLVALGFEDAARLTPLAFALVAATVVLHGFSLRPMGQLLGLARQGTPGVIITGGSQFATSLGKALKALEVPVLISDPNRSHLRSAREAGVPTFFGDILSEAAEHGVEIMNFGRILAVSDNDAYNTLVATDLAPEFGRENVFQLKRAKQEHARHALPASLGGRIILGDLGYYELAKRMSDGWNVRSTTLSDSYGFENWKGDNPDAIIVAELGSGGSLSFITSETKPKGAADSRLLAFAPPRKEKTA